MIETEVQETKEMVITKPKVVIEGNQTTVSFSLQVREEKHKIWFRTSNLPDLDFSNAALATSLLSAMKSNVSLKIEGNIAPKLYQNIQKIQEIFNTWNDEFKLVRVAAETSVATELKSEGGVASFFSGGLDSFYTALKHQKEISHLIFVHGFDVNLRDLSFRERVIKPIREAAALLGKPLLEVETNIRDFSDRVADWANYYHGPALVSAALLLTPKFRKVLIPATYTYASLIPNGSHLILDPLWSTENVEIIHDGCEATRAKKLVFIANFEAARHALHVCWENRDGEYNCGQCEKCLRSMIDIRLAGLSDKFTTFKRGLDLARISRISFKDFHKRPFFEECHKRVKMLGNDPLLEQALRDCLDGVYYRGITGWPRRARNLLKRRLVRHASI